MDTFKQAVKNLAAALGCEICRLKRWGRDPIVDLQALPSGVDIETIFDIGANAGHVAERFSRAFPAATIHAFEPFERSYLVLTELSARSPSIRAIQMALGECVGISRLNINSADVTNSLLKNAPEANTFQPAGFAESLGSTSVVMSTIDAYCEENHIKSVDILKIDTQGYELHVLKGGEEMFNRGLIGAVLIEVLFVPLYVGQAYFHDVYGFLWKHGYRLAGLYDVARTSKGYAAWCDALFVHKGMSEESATGVRDAIGGV